MRMKGIALLIAAILLTAIAVAEEDEFDFGFFDDGYEGEWVSLDALGIEFCLPDGWSQVDAGEADAFAARTGDGSAGLTVRQEAEGISDLLQWADAGFQGYEREEAGFHDALVREADTSLAVRFQIEEDRVIAFDFSRVDEEALSRDFALQVVASVCETWGEWEESMDDIDLWD